MKILYAINSAKIGGAEVHTLDLVRGFVSLGHSVHVWCPAGEMSAKYAQAGALVTNHTIRFDLDPIYIKGLIKYLRANNIDVVHAHELKAVGNAIIAAFFAHTKVRISHSHTPISEWQISSIKKFINSRFFYSPCVNLFSTKEIALTESRKEVKIKEGINANKLVVLPNGIDTAKYALSTTAKADFRREILCRYDLHEGVYIFGNIGRLSIEKGLLDLVDAFANFLKVVPPEDRANMYLMLIGNGTEYEYLRKRVLELDLSQHVIMPGVVFSDEDKLKYLATFDCFIFPSHAEGFGLVLLEAMAMAIPTICSDLPVLQEVGGSSVLFFETGNSQNLSDKMFNIYSKKDMFEEVKENMKSRVDELFSMHTFITNYEDLYINLLGEANL